MIILNLPTLNNKNKHYNLQQIINYNFNNFTNTEGKCNICKGVLQQQSIIQPQSNKILILQLSLFVVNDIYELKKIINYKIEIVPQINITICNENYKMISHSLHKNLYEYRKIIRKLCFNLQGIF